MEEPLMVPPVASRTTYPPLVVMLPEAPFKILAQAPEVQVVAVLVA